MSSKLNTAKQTLTIFVCQLLLTAAAYSQTPTGQRGFCIHGSGVNLPLGKFLLIRRGNQVGALRLTRITPDTNTKPRAREWLGTVAYESYFADEGQAFSNSSVVKTSDELRFGRIKGFGFHYSWQSGDMTARVGPWKFLFFDEDGMYMTTYDRWNGIEHDSGLEFAPTGATELAHINPKDTRLHWYRRDPNTDIPCPIPAQTEAL
jgi:hypothetical protein